MGSTERMNRGEKEGKDEQCGRTADGDDDEDQNGSRRTSSARARRERCGGTGEVQYSNGTRRVHQAWYSDGARRE